MSEYDQVLHEDETTVSSDIQRITSKFHNNPPVEFSTNLRTDYEKLSAVKRLSTVLTKS